MKQQMLLVVLVVLASCGPASAETYKEKWVGFRGITWDTDIKDVVDPNFREVWRDDKTSIVMYVTSTDRLQIGRANLEHIYYTFYNGRLARVNIKTKDSGGSGLKQVVFAHYGEGRQPNEFIDKWVWWEYGMGMILKMELFTEEATIIMFSQVVQARINADEARQDAESGGDF